MPSPEALFSLASTAVLPGWLLLVLAPRWRYTARLVAVVLIPGLLGLLYVVLIAARWGSAEGGFSSLADVRRLFGDPYLLLAGWVHYLAFDLFVGAWEVRDAQRLRVPHLLVGPCLVLTFLFGPAGLLLYGVVRAVRSRQVLVDEASA
jgi:Domain of unknown function (DUF4281)